jgi:pyruvate formate lyase activating enzyme
MRCDYCYNSDIVFAKNGNYTINDIVEFLKTRIGLLDGVVLSGGEATEYDLVEFCKEIKKLNFSIKLDTNGTNPYIIDKLLELNLLDFIALDYKAPKEKFVKITHSKSYDKFSKTLNMLIKSDIVFEVRTTIHANLLDVDDINTIIYDLKNRGYSNKYYLQEFLDTQINIANLKKPSKVFDKSKLLKELEIIWR